MREPEVPVCERKRLFKIRSRGVATSGCTRDRHSPYKALPFLDGQELVGVEIMDRFDAPVRPVDLDDINSGVLSQSIVQAQVAGGEIASAAMDLIPLHQVA